MSRSTAFVAILLYVTIFWAGIKAQDAVYGDGFSRKLSKALKHIQNNETLLMAFEEHANLLRESRRTTTIKSTTTAQWPCPLNGDVQSIDDVPASVHRLRPGDINVIAAIGDSITAGNGINALTVLGVLTQYRGYSWSVGGDKKYPCVPTLANFLKLYNSDVKGYSLRTGAVNSRNAHLNQAVPGSKARDMPGQARKLVDKLKSTTDFQNDWKVITLFIGGNDLCDYCIEKNENTPEKYIAYIKEALDILHKEVPRAFINLVEMLEIEALAEVGQGLICNTLHYFLCDCVANPKTPEDKKELVDTGRAYQKSVGELVDTGRYDTRDDFTVVVQPFFRHTTPPLNSKGKPDLAYFAPDCFHFSDLGHAAAAEALWNNMIEPIGQKRTDWRLGEPIECPETSFPYISTSKNSDEVNAARDKTLQTRAFVKGFGVQQVGSNSMLQHQTADSTISSSLLGGVTAGVLLIGIIGVVIGVTIAIRRRRRSRQPILMDHPSTITYSHL